MRHIVYATKAFGSELAKFNYAPHEKGKISPVI